MLTKRITLAMSAIGLVLSLAAVPALAKDDMSGSAGQDISQSLHDIKTYSIKQKDAAVEKGQELIDEMDRKIESLQQQAKAKAQDASAETKAQWQNSLAKLHDLREAAAEKFVAMKEGTADAWDDVKDGFRDAASALSDKVQAAQDELGS